MSLVFSLQCTGAASIRNANDQRPVDLRTVRACGVEGAVKRGEVKVAQRHIQARVGRPEGDGAGIDR